MNNTAINEIYKPEHPILVTAAIIKNKKGEYLITQRKPGAHNGLRWEFPGGKLELGETPEDCLKREIKEELGIDIEVKDVFDVSSFVYEKKEADKIIKKHIVLVAYHCEYHGPEDGIKKDGINNYAWASIDDFKNKKYDITEADQRFVEKLCKEH